MGKQQPSVESLLGIDGSGPTGPLALPEAVRCGLPLAALDGLVELIAPGEAGLRDDLLPRSTLTRRRRKPGPRLTLEEGNRVARLAKVAVATWRVHTSAAHARAFLLTPNPQLDGRKPYQVALATTPGADAVLELLGTQVSA